MKPHHTFEPQQYTEKLIHWLNKTCHDYPAKGFTIGISGGIDSAVTASILQQTNYPCTGIILPSPYNDNNDIDDALALVKQLNIDHFCIPLEPVLNTVMEQTQIFSSHQQENTRAQVITGNVQARLRMLYLYAHAQSHQHLVVGTDNACEWHMGYFTKFGDGGVDINPLFHLLKQDVYCLAKYLNIPPNIYHKAPSAGLWAGQTDETEMGVSYAEIDAYLSQQPVSDHALNRIYFWHERSHHKRQLPLTPDF